MVDVCCLQEMRWTRQSSRMEEDLSWNKLEMEFMVLELW